MTRSPGERRRTIGDAKAHFAELIRESEAGESVVLTRHGRPVARLQPYEERGRPGTGGAAQIREETTAYGAREGDGFRSLEARRAALRRLLEKEIWPRVPKRLRGTRLSKKEREAILGYGDEGV